MSTESKQFDPSEQQVSDMADEGDVDEEYVRQSIEFQKADEEFTKQTVADERANATSTKSLLSNAVFTVLNWLFLTTASYMSHATVTDFNYSDHNNEITLKYLPLSETDHDLDQQRYTFDLDEESDRAELRRLLRFLRLPRTNPSKLANATLPIKTTKFSSGTLKVKLHTPPAAVGFIPFYLLSRLNKRFNFVSFTSNHNLLPNRRFYLFYAITTFPLGYITTSATKALIGTSSTIGFSIGIGGVLLSMLGVLFAIGYATTILASAVIGTLKLLFTP